MQFWSLGFGLSGCFGLSGSFGVQNPWLVKSFTV